MYHLANKYKLSLLFSFLKTKYNMILLPHKTTTIKKLKSTGNNTWETKSP